MERLTEHKIVLNWSHEGRFSAVIINGTITDVTMCEPGTGEEDPERCLRSINPVFLKNVYSSLGELFKVQQDEEARLGYSYALPEDTEKLKP